MFDIVNHIIDVVTEASAPFKEEVVFVKKECDMVTILRNDVYQKVHSRYVYATANHLKVGDKFSVDSRFIVTI